MVEKFILNTQFNPSVDQNKVITVLTDNMNKGKDKQVLLGVTGSGKTFVMANMIEKLQKPTLVLSHNKTLAAQLYEEFKQFFPNNAVKYFVSYYDYYQPEAYVPSKDLYIEKESEVNEEIEKLRLSAMTAARTRRDTIVVASVSCIYNIGSPDNYENRSFEIRIGDKVSIEDLAKQLTFLRYERESIDLVSGSFLVRGDTVEIYMPYEEFPLRIEFWGNEIETMSIIDPISKQRIDNIDKQDIFPATPFVYDQDTMTKAVTNIEKDLEKRMLFLKNIGKDIEAYRLETKTRYDIEMMREIGFCKSMENYSIYFDGRRVGEPPYTLLDYFPDDYLMFIDESHITIPQVRGMYDGDRSRKTNLIEYGFRLPTAYDNRPLNFNEFGEKQKQTIYFSATPNSWEIEDSNKVVVELLTRPTGLLDPEISVRPILNQIDDVIKEVRENTEREERVLITTLTKRMAEELTSYLQDFDIKVAYLHSEIDTVERVEILRDLRLGEYDVLVGINLLREGIDLPEVSLVIILDADKEGFLRSKTSLIQTIGRAARHINSRVIMYADTVTESMKYAIDETDRRRKYQEDYNKKYNITPRSIKKEIGESLIEKDTIYKKELDIQIDRLSTREKKLFIKDLRSKMLLAADNLQFEKAAEIRDKIKELSI
ncbi:excinuclease ABC subunit UvrB [Candidatus Dojkabacteria bacterium]|uniref:UvrABC system protein B n=1 Tax=Candidatus Dojkabacteria bacterium TaxID=2099670 RepID=A0A847VCS9_9BACT|nr:excinuclease ABC subunit UvrB [Candidatus Dojkabacteria bacterium]